MSFSRSASPSPRSDQARQDEALLLVSEVDVQTGQLLLAALLGQGEAQVAVEQMPRALVNDDLLNPADIVERGLESRTLVSRMDSEVERVGERL